MLEHAQALQYRRLPPSVKTEAISMPRLSAQQLEDKYGHELRSFGNLGARGLLNALQESHPTLDLGDQAFRTWIEKYRNSASAAASSAARP